MPYLGDKNEALSVAQAITATAISDVLPLIDGTSNSATRWFSGDKRMWLEVYVNTTFTASGSATLTISLESDSTADLATAPVVHWTSAAIPKATLVSGYRFFIPIPDDSTYKKYLGLRYTVATGPMTAGAITAIPTDVRPEFVAYATTHALRA